MKRTFPIIIILITLSLAGLIFFQYLWLKNAKDIKSGEVDQKITNAVSAAGNRLMEEKSVIVRPQKNDLLFPGKKLPWDPFSVPVSRKFTKQEVDDIIRTEMAKAGLGGVPFEFAIGEPENDNESIIRLSSDNFMKYSDFLNYRPHNYLLLAASGSSMENLMPEEMLYVVVPSQKTLVIEELKGIIFGTLLFTVIIIAAFYVTVRTLLRQKKLSEIKNDFINNMTHEFKTPLATISLAVDALKTEKVTADKDKSNYFIGIIKEENRRMNKQVESILQAAQLDKNEIQLNLKVHHAHELIQKAVNNISLPVAEKGGKMLVEFNAANDLVEVDEVHFINFVNNLLENGVKYSKEDVSPVLKLTTTNEKSSLKIRVEDNGIGMNKETLSRIFEKFYRAHTGNVHNVKGFGLGLSYVKTMVEAHKGTVKAESVSGKGSTFILTIPSVRT